MDFDEPLLARLVVLREAEFFVLAPAPQPTAERGAAAHVTLTLLRALRSNKISEPWTQ